MLVVGLICAIVSGIGQPVLAILSGQVTNVLLTQAPGSEQFNSKAYLCVYLYLGIGCLVLVMNYAQFMCLQTTCCRLVARLRQQYIRSILRQNAAWFDRNQSVSIISTCYSNIERIREGIGDKLGLLVRGFAMFISAIITAFSFQWRLALAMVPVVPISCFIMAQLAQQMGSRTAKELIGIGKAGAIAEEAILGVRTVQAFNGQEEMVERYKTQLSRGKKYGISKSCWSGFLGGLFFLVLLIFMGGGMLFVFHLNLMKKRTENNSQSVS
ncbi:unnamed protein product [Gongylonema pulchrum]|uniref:ABC transmembrane type-1 domain-containing protein n=1 Tax=Gongylonema pulchrum TaxID=637853 RepID=A0A183CYU0_9BILA|nr:unnamed protein product [Gongylonema pulchrum]